MLDTPAMEVFETLKHLQSVDHDDLLILDTTMLEQIRQTSTLAVLFKDVHSVSMYLAR